MLPGASASSENLLEMQTLAPTQHGLIRNSEGGVQQPVLISPLSILMHVEKHSVEARKHPKTIK